MGKLVLERWSQKLGPEPGAAQPAEWLLCGFTQMVALEDLPPVDKE